MATETFDHWLNGAPVLAVLPTPPTSGFDYWLNGAPILDAGGVDTQGQRRRAWVAEITPGD